MTALGFRQGSFEESALYRIYNWDYLWLNWRDPATTTRTSPFPTHTMETKEVVLLGTDPNIRICIGLYLGMVEGDLDYPLYKAHRFLVRETFAYVWEQHVYELHTGKLQA
jgi:hypothetical protein